MNRSVIRVLKTCLIAASISAVIGYVLGSVAAILMESEMGGISRDPEEMLNVRAAAQNMKIRIPLLCAGATTLLIVVMEGFFALVRPKIAKTPPAPPCPPTHEGMDPEVEALLNQILAQSGQLVETPPPVAFREGRTLSTTH
ncbi:MAG: hypothetical protein ACRC8S_08270 [Fimbriiglobus sp.]